MKEKLLRQPRHLPCIRTENKSSKQEPIRVITESIKCRSPVLEVIVEATMAQTRTMMKIMMPTTKDDDNDDGSRRGSGDADDDSSGPECNSC